MAILKRLFVIFLLTLFLTPSFATATPLPESSFTYIIDGGKASITGYTGTNTDIIIPTQIDGYSVESISNGAFDGLVSLERVELSEGIKRIGSSAFADCQNLEDIILPDSLISLGSDVFFNCNKLKKLTIPQNTTEIGSWPYFQCNMLEVILVDDDNQEYASLNGVLFSKDMKTLIRYPQGKKENTYYIPEGVVAIGDGAFMDCQNLDAINIAGTVAQINEWAFNGCPNVKQFIVPNSVKSVGSRAFDQSGMESIIFPESVEKWGSCVLWSNINLKQIEFLAENPSEDLSRCIIEDELIMPNLETIYVPYGTKGEYEGVLEEYFHSYIQEREESWNDSTPAVSPAPVTPTPSVSDKDYGKTKSEVIQNIGYAQGQTTYRYGDTGSVVLFIQDVLKQLDLYNGVVSGNFGYNTQDAVKEFQRQNGLAPDGVCGWNTIDMLIDSYLNLLEKPSTPEPTATPTPTPTPTIEPTPAFPNLGNIFGNLGSAGKYPLKRPTLILSEDGHDLLGVGYLSFEIIETSEKAITYEIDLYDAWGREIALPGECKLIFPYPEGITISNRHGWRVTITHYGEDQTTKYSSEDGSIEFLPLGLCIRVSSLSPFVIEWEKSVAPDTLPQTGDNTSLPMLALVLLLSLALIYRLNYKRINA